MKKLMYLLLALPFVALTACDDEDSMPNVTLHMEYEGAQEVNNVYYVVQGEPFTITSMTAIPNREGAKASVSNVFYTLDGRPYGVANVAPFGQEFETENMEPGDHVIGATMQVLEVGCSPAEAWVKIDLKVVTNADEIPSSTTPSQSNTISVRPALQN